MIFSVCVFMCVPALCVLGDTLLACRWAQTRAVICLTDEQPETKTSNYTSHPTKAPYKSLPSFSLDSSI